MNDSRPEASTARSHLAAWKLPPTVASIALPIIAGFYVGGPGLGMAVGALAAAAIIVIAVRKPPLQSIVPLEAADLRAHILVVLSGPLDESAAAPLTAHLTQAGAGGSASPEVLLVAPCRQRFLDRWTSDVGPGRDRAQRNLVQAAAELARTGIEASARIGDENLVQTVEDELRSFPATEVILVSDGSVEEAQTAAQALIDRLQVPLRQFGGDAASPKIPPGCKHAGGDERLLGQARRPARVSHRRLRAT
jgi:hypothetical protein